MKPQSQLTILEPAQTGSTLPWFGNFFETSFLSVALNKSSRFDRHMYHAVIPILYAFFTFKTGFSYNLKGGPRRLAKGGLGTYASSLKGVSSRLLDSDPDTATTVRKWHFLSQKSRADDVYVSQSGGDMVEVATEVWKSVLVSLRVLEKLESESHDALIVLPKMSLSEVNHTQLKSLAKVLEEGMGSATAILQPNFLRKVEVLKCEEKFFILWVASRREKPVVISYDDLDTYVPDVAGVVTNDIPGFPFDSVYDFIAEINRPIDKVSMSTLRFRFTIQDLRYDVEKVKKKKDPQEMVDAVNCKLTRLALWRDVLSSASNGPDFFKSEVDWSEKVKTKYFSMRTLLEKNEYSKLLDTQYDKKKTFIKIIDQWSDRLKRNFKFIFQSQREPVDFNEQVMRADWRLQLITITSVLSKVPLLSVPGPSFSPGAPAPLFPPNRHSVWPANYRADEAFFEMLTWMRSVDKLKMSLGLPSTPVSRLAFCRGWVTESMLVDSFRSLLIWLNDETYETIAAPRATLRRMHLLLDDKEGAVDGSSHDDEDDHLKDYFKAVAAVNSFVRARSQAEQKGVKEMFRDWIRDGKAFIEWFTTLMRDLDLVDRLAELEAERSKPWSVVIQDLLHEELMNSDRDLSENVVDPDVTMAVWETYKPVLEHAEFLQAQFPWLLDTYLPSVETISQLQKLGDFTDELVVVDLTSSDGSVSKEREGFLLVAPRYFRGSVLKEEHDAFMDFVALLTRTLDALTSSGAGKRVAITAFHPDASELTHRAPHPAILFTRK